MKYLILPVSKNPAFGRLGPKRFQDWYRSCKRAVEVEKRLCLLGNDAEIIVVSGLAVPGFRDETSVYFEALNELGGRNIRKIGTSYETIGEVGTALNLAEKEKSGLIIISTFGHYLRTAWLIRGSDATHIIAFGLPRFKELITDLALSFIFPIIDWFGRRAWFQEKVIRRRQAGRH